MSLELIKIWLCLGFDVRSRDYDSHALTTQSRTLNKLQRLASNKAENRCYEIFNTTDLDYSKKATK